MSQVSTSPSLSTSTPTPAPSQSVNLEDILHALRSYAGRVAQSDDPKQHQEAAQQLQKNLRQVKIEA